MSNNASASPHLSHLSHNGSAPASPSMPSQVQGGAAQQQVYQSSTGYPSPAHYSQYTTQAASAEGYRASPTGSNGSMPLPSMRSIDPNHAQQAHQAQHMANSHLQGPPGPYYHGNVLPPPAHYPSVTSDPSGRYALPQDNRVMSGGRHKKEIKRRTKTGCLTCRKRRIKCDEAHPTCRNCTKSKRDCLGYDPIFKQNPGPTAIQPALSATPNSTMSSSSHPYGNQPPMYTQGLGYDQSLSAAVNAPGQPQQYSDYPAVSAIDPSLEALAPSQPNAAQAMPNFREELQKGTAGSPYSARNIETPHLRGGAPSKSTPLSTALRYGKRKLTYDAPAQPTSVTDILDSLGPAAEPLDANGAGIQDPQMLDELKHLYHSIYSPGLENFLESKYFLNPGISRLLGDRALLEQFIVLIRNFASVPGTDQEGLQRVAVIETRLIWALADMVRGAAAAAKEASNGVKAEDQAQPQGPPSPEDPVEAGRRLTVFEKLLTFDFAESNQLYKTVPDAVDYHKGREFEFWYHLGAFVAIKDSDENAGQQIDELLLKMRNLLDGRENRDVLYSIAVVRAIGNRVADFAEQEVPHHLDETDDRNKLFVAKKFIRDESNGNGTTNVIRRLCDMVLRSWTAPPVTKAQ